MITIDTIFLIMDLMSHDIDHGTDYASRFIYAISTAQAGGEIYN